MRTVDLFAGCGGMSLGFQQAGFEIVGAFDNWEAAREVYRANFNHPVYAQDLSDIQASVEAIVPLNPEVIIGGPPCQDYSHAGKRDEEGGRADLTLSFARIITQIQPRFFVMENVDQIHKSNRFRQALALFKQAGYGLTYEVLEASDFGVPQYRKRMFLLGVLGGADNAVNLELEERSQAISVKAYFQRQSIPLTTDYYYRHPRNYSRRAIYSVEEPSPTIRGVNRPIPKTYKPHPLDAAHPEDAVRPLSTLERSYIQTFPTTFVWKGTKTALEQMIGNAVPVLLATTLAHQIYQQAHQKPLEQKVVQPVLGF